MPLDYITLLLLSVTTGLVVLGVYFASGITRGDARHYAPAAALPGIVSLIAGLHMCLTWPIPHKPGIMWANMVFGETSAFFGALMLAFALAIAMNWRLSIVAIGGAMLGALAIVLGAGVLATGVTAAPAMTATMFIVSGIAGVLSLPAVLRPAARFWRWCVALLLFGASALWLFTTLMSYWAHLERYAGKIAG
jgi:uncharacterized membrane protein